MRVDDGFRHVVLTLVACHGIASGRVHGIAVYQFQRRLDTAVSLVNDTRCAAACHAGHGACQQTSGAAKPRITARAAPPAPDGLLVPGLQPYALIRGHVTRELIGLFRILVEIVQTMDGVGNSTTNTPDLEKDKHIPDPYRNFNLGLNFQWEADIWGKLTDKKRSAVSRWMQSVEAMRLARTLLISEVGTHYFELIGLDKQRYVLREAILTARDAYNLTDELMKEGEVTRLSVDQFRSRRLKLEEMLLANEQQISEKERAIATLLGRLPFKVKRVSFETACSYEFPTDAGIPSQLLQYRPAIQAVR